MTTLRKAQCCAWLLVAGVLALIACEMWQAAHSYEREFKSGFAMED